MKSVVAVRKCNEYDPAQLARSLEKVLDDLGGLQSFVKRGDRVLLKPNMLKAASPDKAVVTHPSFVETIAAMLLDFGCTPFVGDSPPLGNLARVLSKSGYDGFMKRMNVRAAPFVDKTPLECSEGRLFRHIEIAGEVFQYDAIFNLPKVKTHCQMFLTLAVKNLFGTIIGTDKASLHLSAGKDFDLFATVLVQIFEKVRPAVSILDGILAMEGNGPNSGKPRHLGVVAASTDGVAMDATICRLLGLPVEKLRTCVIGEALGLGNADSELIEVVGDDLAGFPLRDFAPPKSMTVTWNMSRGNRLRGFLESHVATRPEIDSAVCLNCGICLKHCPPGAISEDNGNMVIDRKKCISCFCCHELCGNEAVQIVRPWLGRVLASWSR